VNERKNGFLSDSSRCLLALDGLSEVARARHKSGTPHSGWLARFTNTHGCMEWLERLQGFRVEKPEKSLGAAQGHVRAWKLRDIRQARASAPENTPASTLRPEARHIGKYCSQKSLSRAPRGRFSGYIHPQRHVPWPLSTGCESGTRFEVCFPIFIA